MKIRSRLAAGLAAIALVGGLIAFDGGTARAATTVIDCDHVAGTGTIKPPLANTLQASSAVLKATFFGTCTEAPGFPTVGPLTKIAGKVVGQASCNTGLVATPPDPLDGKVTFTYTEINPVTLKPYQSAMWIRVAANPTVLDQLDVANGIVIKGIGVGADVHGSVLFQPVQAKGGPADQSTIDGAGNIVPGPGSLTLGTNCLLGTGTVATVIFGTDGTSLLGATLDSSLSLVYP